MADDDDKTTNDKTNEAEEAEAEETVVDEEESEASSDGDSSDGDSSDGDSSDGDSSDGDSSDGDSSDGDSDGDSSDPFADSPEPKKKKRTKKRAVSGGTKKKTTRKKASAAKARGPAPAPEDDEDDNGTMMALGAFVLAILAIGALWWWNSRGADEEETVSSEETVEPAEDEDARDPADLPSNLAEALGHPPPREAPPRPPQIPAPDDVAAAPENATTTESGLAYRVIEAGTGEDHPAAIDRVTVHYTGWTTDGQMFDSSRARGRPATFPLNGVIAGWTEGVQLMVVGETTRFWIPQELAYGGRPGAPAGMLVFDVELVSFDVTPPPPATPEDVAAVPSNATTTASGLAYRVLEAGTGTEHPAATNRVSVHYTGWTTDGESFDSSVTRGRPATFPLNGVIAGWTEGVQLMVVGERTRFWIPEALAYGGRAGAPAGMLVFDVELLEILPAPPTRSRMPGMPSGHP